MNWMNDDGDDNNGTTMISLLHRRLVDSGLALCKFWGWRWYDYCISDGLGWYDEIWLLHQRRVGSGEALQMATMIWWRRRNCCISGSSLIVFSPLAFSRDDNNDDKMTVTMMPTPTPMPTPMPIPPIRTMPPMPMPAASSLPMPMSMPPMPPMQPMQPMQPMPIPMTRTGWGEREVNWMLQPATVRWICKTKDASQKQYSRW